MDSSEESASPPVYTWSNPRPQSYSFLSCYMTYIQKNLSPAITIKLIKTCKAFKPKANVYFIDRLDINSTTNGGRVWSEKWSGIPLFKSFVNFNDGRKPIIATDALYVSGDKKALSKVLEKCHICCLNDCAINNQELEYNEYQSVVSEVRELWLTNVDIKYNDGSLVPFEKIVFAGHKKLLTLCYSHNKFPPISSYIHNIEMKRLQNIYLGRAPEMLEPSKLYHFLQKCPTLRSVEVIFSTYRESEPQETFTEELKDLMLSWNPALPEPVIHFYRRSDN